MKGAVTAGLAAIVLGITGLLYVGVYRDREFGDQMLFLKHRPSSTFFFRAPLGESDSALSSLSDADRHAEREYVEFVEQSGGFQRSIRIGQ